MKGVSTPLSFSKYFPDILREQGGYEMNKIDLERHLVNQLMLLIGENDIPENFGFWG